MPWSSPLGSRRCPPTRTKAGWRPCAFCLAIILGLVFFFWKKKSSLASPVMY
jgi:hypothetical protein